MPKLDLNLSTQLPILSLIDKFLDFSIILLESASPSKRQEIAHQVLDGWLFWQRLGNSMLDQLAQSQPIFDIDGGKTNANAVNIADAKSK